MICMRGVRRLVRIKKVCSSSLQFVVKFNSYPIITQVDCNRTVISYTAELNTKWYSHILRQTH